jgi:hypothetical protein
MHNGVSLLEGARTESDAACRGFRAASILRVPNLQADVRIAAPATPFPRVSDLVEESRPLIFSCAPIASAKQGMEARRDAAEDEAQPALDRRLELPTATRLSLAQVRSEIIETLSKVVQAGGCCGVGRPLMASRASLPSRRSLASQPRSCLLGQRPLKPQKHAGKARALAANSPRPVASEISSVHGVSGTQMEHSSEGHASQGILSAMARMAAVYLFAAAALLSWRGEGSPLLASSCVVLRRMLLLASLSSQGEGAAGALAGELGKAWWRVAQGRMSTRCGRSGFAGVPRCVRRACASEHRKCIGRCAEGGRTPNA